MIKFSIPLEPVQVRGYERYNLNILKEIKVTESFLGMDMDVKKCQDEIPIEECTTRHFIDDLLDQCGCLPLSLTSNNNKVRKLFQRNISFQILCYVDNKID